MQKPKKPGKKPKAAEQEAKPLKPKQKRSLKRFEKQKQKNVRQTVEEIVKEYDSLKEKPTTAFRTFNDFPLSTATKSGLDEAGFVTPTEIQRDSLPHSLRGADLIGAAKTGSGKTLALVIPLLENLWRNRWTHDEGLGAVIISPTRELALQTFNTINTIGKYHDFSCCLMIGGGTDIEFEKARIGRMNIIVCTPGRLLQHLNENETFYPEQLQILVIDEADRILDMGFAKQMNAIVESLPKERQTLLFSATQTKNVADLSRVCTKDPVFVSVHEEADSATPDKLEQLYLVCEEEQKLNILWSFITAHRKAKTLVFVSTCKQARFIYEAFHKLNPSVILLGLWGSMKQSKRIEVFEKYQKTFHACLVATDVASRGLDFSGVDWVVQIDAPPEIDDYIHRVGRTARMDKGGESLLFLTPNQEEPMGNLLKQRKIPVSKMDVDPRSQKDIQRKLQSTLAHHPELHDFAQRAFVSYVRSVFVMKNKDVFDVEKIHTKELAESMGLVSVPRIRFLKRQGIELGKEKTTKPSVEFSAGNGFGDLVDDIAADDLFAVKKKDIFAVEEEAEAEPEEETKPQKKARILTKEELARKILNKNVKVNTRTVFEDPEDSDGEGEREVDRPAAGPSEGLDIEEAKKEKALKDKGDRIAYRARLRELKKQKKLKERKTKTKKTEDDELELGDDDDRSDDEGPDLSWLPKPVGYDSDEEDDLPAEYDPSLDTKLEEKRAKALDKQKKRPAAPVNGMAKKMKRSAELSSMADVEQQALALLSPF